MSARENLGASEEGGYDHRSQWKLIDYIASQYANVDVSQLTKFQSNVWDLRRERLLSYTWSVLSEVGIRLISLSLRWLSVSCSQCSAWLR